MATFDSRLRVPKDNSLIFSDAQALPNATNVDSTNRLDLKSANVYGKVPVFIMVDCPVRTYVSAFTINVYQSADDSTYVLTHTINVPAAALAAADKRKVIGLASCLRYVKLNYSTAENLSATAATAWLAPMV